MNKNKIQVVVLAKQVPDTRNVGKDAMKEDGTINRAALPAVFNPDDMKALEMALEVKDRLDNVKVTVITMGPSRAADIIRESIFRGADDGFVVSDRKFAGSDTLATSYALSLAVKKLGKVDIIFSGRQAIDGDTAQVGPQVAEKLNISQLTYAEELMNVTNDSITIKRRIERGVEVAEAKMPVLITVHGNAKDCRPRYAANVIRYKRACSASEAREQNKEMEGLWSQRPFLKIDEWTAADMNPEESRLGLNGSPTKVKTIENVVLTSKENVIVENNEAAIDEMMKGLIIKHII